MSEVRGTSKVITLLVTCLGTFMILLDTSIVILAVPRIQTDLHASLSDVQWVVDGYTLPFAILMLTAGTFGDRFGRKRLFVIGLVVFVFGSACSGFAQSLGWLLFGRVVQGIGAAALSTNSLAVLAAAFSDPRERAQAIGLFSSLSGIALALGPLVGGALVQVGSWPLIFLVNLPIGLIGFILALPNLSESRNPDARRIDVPGQLLVITGLTCLVMAIIESSSYRWTSPLILGLLVGAVVFLAVFALVEARVREPLLPLQLFRIPLFSAANLVALVFGSTVAPTFFIAQYFQEVQGYSVLGAGLRTLPLSVGAFLIAPVAGRITSRIGPRVPAAFGAALCGVAVLLLMLLEPDSHYAVAGCFLGLMGIGFGLMFSPTIAAIFTVTPPHRVGLSSSMVSASRQLGATLGVAALGAIVVQFFSSNVVSQLTQQGVSRSLSTTIANQIAATGADAGNRSLPNLPISPVAFHQAMNQAFVDAIHSSFLISGIALLVCALVIAFTFQRRGAAKKEANESQVTAEAQAVVTVDSEER